MMQPKRKGHVAEAPAGTVKGLRRTAWDRALPPSLLRGVIGGDGGVQDAANFPPETPPSGPRG